MKRLCVAGPPEAGTTAVIERLLDRLDGRVATVDRVAHGVDVDTEGTPTQRHRAAGASASYAVSDDGAWFATGRDRSLDDLLADLVPDHDYVLVEGSGEAALPTVAVGDCDPAGEVVAAAPTAGEVDYGAVEAALADQEPYETLESLVARAKRAEGEEFAGAIATFTGRVRRQDGPDDTPTAHLAFEKYEEVADERLATIREELCAREGVHEVLLHHRTGVVEAGEDIVFVVVLAGHREEAFATVSDGIDRLKAEVPFFKKEVTVDGEFWAHEPDVAGE